MAADSNVDMLNAWHPLTFAKKKKVFELPRPLAPIFDTHAHLRSFWGEDKDAVAVLTRAYVAGVRRIVTLYDPISDASKETPDVQGFSAWLNAVIAKAKTGRGDVSPREDVLQGEGTARGVFAEQGGTVAQGTRATSIPQIQYLVGVHPYGAPEYSDEHHAQLDAALNDPLCAGIGEIGLDYHFDADDNVEAAPHGLQMEVMARQLEIAIRHNVPVELHIRNDADDERREAHADALKVLREIGVPQAGCVLHCFGEDRVTMERFLEMGCHIAFGGAATFKRNDAVREAFAACPLDRLLLETDCPYMAPEPLRGLECEPAMIAQTADVLIYDRADRTGELPEQIARAIWDTSTALFA